MARLNNFRNLLKKQNLDGFLVPRTDAYQNEYIAPDQERLAWLTGFTGSAGTALILHDRAALFVDGRYITQAPQQVPADYTVHLIPDHPATAWLNQYAADRAIGFDPWLHTEKQMKTWQAACPSVTFVHVETNPIDALWHDRPAPSIKPAWIHPEHYAGQSWIDKVSMLRRTIITNQADSFLLTDPASLCWLFNIRGGDIPYTPLLLGYALVSLTDIFLFVEPEKIPKTILTERPDIRIVAAQHIVSHLIQQTGKILFDPAECPLALSQILPKAHPLTNPCLLAKAIKNPTEQRGMRAAHLRDGAALTRALTWLREAWLKEAQNPVTECDIEDRLLMERQKEEQFYDLSFPTIAGAGPNGAIIHYRATQETCRTLNPNGDLVLIDSGAQYYDGTTDVTRTVWVGPSPAPDDIKRLYTLVLIGHIRLAMARFPVGTTGAQLDILARSALWQAGLDYRHGTGHGVGSFLSVHEGPCGISSRYTQTPLQAGMVLSNEPGYYRPDAFGIRLENLVLVRDDLPQPDGAEIPMLGFETLTRAPFEETLVDFSLLTKSETDWLLAYQKQCHS